MHGAQSTDRRFQRTKIAAFVALAVTALSAPSAGAGDPVRIFATQSRLSTPNFQLFLGLNADTTVASSGPLFTLGGVYGGTFFGDTYYTTELDNSNLTDYYLAMVPVDSGFFGQGQRVGASPIGWPGVEGLAAGDGVLYGTAIDFPNHKTTLLMIDPSDGSAVVIGDSDRNVILVGLAFDPYQNTLYGAGIPFGSGEPTAVDDPSLFMVDPDTGDTTLIAPLGSSLQTLDWDEDLGLYGAAGKIYSVDPLTGVTVLAGNTCFTDGMPGTFNGIYSMGSKSRPLCGDANGDRSITATDALRTLKVAVSPLDCSVTVCDVDNSCSITATDALGTLKNAVGGTPDLTCPVNGPNLCGFGGPGR